MKRCLLPLFAVGVSFCATGVGAENIGLQAMSDDDMELVAAQQGIALDMELRINAKADGEPVDSSECPTVGGLTGGSSCRLAIGLSDRMDGDGMWIVMKSYRGIIKLNNIRLDASSFGGSSTHRNLPAMGGYDPNNKPALQLTAGKWATALATSSSAYNIYLNTPDYTDFTAALSIDRLSAEYDSGGQPGYLRNDIAGAALAMRMAHGIGLVPDPNNPPDVMVGPYTNEPARIRLDGRLQIHGFGF